MRQIDFEDEITQEKYTYFLPGDWDELTADQLLFLIELVDNNISAEEIKLKMFLFCLKGRVKKDNIDLSYRVKLRKQSFDLSVEELYAICEIFDYLFTEDMQRVNPSFLVNPFPVIRIGWIKLYGPADGFTDMIYETFAKLQIEIGNVDKSEKYVNDFISIFYRLKSGKASKFVRFIPYKKKVALLWFFSSCMNFMMEKFPQVFSGDGSGSGDISDGQMRVIDALAKNDPTKKEKVRKALLYDNLYSMQLAAEEYERINKKD